MYHFIPFITSIFVERCHRKKEKKRSRKNHTWTDNEVGEWMNNFLISFSSHYLLTVWQREWHRWQGKTSFHECLCVYLTRRGVSKTDFGVYSMKACLLSACVFVYVCRWQKMAASLVIVVYLHIKVIQRQTQRKYTYCGSVLSFLWGVIVFGVSIQLLWSCLNLKSRHLSWCLC